MRPGRMVALLPLLAAAACRERADLVIFNGVVWTGASSGAPQPGAVAVREGRVSFVGDSAAVARHVGARTAVLDAAGGLVMPGFGDGHSHFVDGGFQLDAVDLRDAATPAEFVRRIKEFAQRLRPGEWILGGDWDHELWPGAALPRRDWIDSVTPQNPVFVTRLDGHMALANTSAIRAAAVTRDTPAPAGGEIVRDPASGEPHGVFKDAAMGLIWEAVPPPSPQQTDSALARALAHAASLGVTATSHVSATWAELASYRRLREAGRLTLRAYLYLPLSQWRAVAETVRVRGAGDDWLRIAGLKGVVDGSAGSRTAYFFEAFSDSAGYTGLLTTPEDSLRVWIGNADSAGLQLAVHAIGDRANDWLLDTFAHQAVIAIENARLYDNLRSVSRRYQELHQFNSRILKSANLGIYTIDAGLRVTSWNPRMEELSGLAEEEALGHDLLQLFPILEEEGFAERVRRVLQRGIPEKVRLAHRNMKGELRFQKRRLAPLKDGERTTGVVVIVEDITEFKRLLEQTIQSEKLAEVGRLSAGIAHEVNNPLAVISYAAQLLLREEELPPFQKELAERIDSEVDRLKALTGSLLSFSRAREMVRRETDLNEVLRDVLRLVRYELNRHSIRLVEDFAELPAIQADPNKLKQVFINLIMNASQAMPEGGTLSVRTALVAGEEVEAVISDSGPGIPPEVREKIFEPFFSTKREGEGTGLGLYICRNIVTEHEGRLLLDSVPGQGATFRVVLPLGLVQLFRGRRVIGGAAPGASPAGDETIKKSHLNRKKRLQPTSRR